MSAVRLSEIVSDAKSGFASGEDDDDGIVQVRMNNITTEGRLLWDRIRRVPRPKNIEQLLAEPGDILFNATNSPELVGKSALFNGYDEPVTFSNHFVRLRVNQSLADPSFVSRVLQDRWSKRVFAGMCKQWVNQASVSKEDLLAIDISLPPLNEQKRIAAILDQVDELRRLRQCTMKRVGELGQAIFKEMFGDPAINPMGWPTGQLGEVIRADDRINYGVVQPGEPVDSGVPLVRVADIVSPIIDVKHLKKIAPSIEAAYSRSRLNGDEILVGCVGSIGAVSLADQRLKGANIARAVGRVPVDPKKADRHFVVELMRTANVQRYFVSETRTVAQPTLNIKQLIETPIFLPPLADQKHFSERMAVVESQTVASAAHLRAIGALFASLQHRAFRGEM